MLSGRRAIEGEDVSEILASVIKGEVGWDYLPADIGGRIRRILERCLTKDLRTRLQAIGEARITVQEVGCLSRLR
jgi:hypothetical protein